MEAGRDIPEGIKKKLREEVGYRCAVCGNPFLTYHHFDPPWHVGHEHPPDGMIALCLQHAGIADGGGYTDQELRDFKRRPWTASNPVAGPAGAFTWKRRNLLLMTGGGLFLQVRVLLRMGMDVIWTEEDEQGRSLLNIELRDRDGEEVLRMRNNEWSAFNFSDLVCGARAKNLYVRTGSTRLKLTWHHLTRDKLFKSLKADWAHLRRPELDMLEGIFEDGKATVLHLEGNIEWPRQVLLGERRIAGPRGLSARGFFAGRVAVALSL